MLVSKVPLLKKGDRVYYSDGDMTGIVVSVEIKLFIKGRHELTERLVFDRAYKIKWDNFNILQTFYEEQIVKYKIIKVPNLASSSVKNLLSKAAKHEKSTTKKRNRK